MSTKVIRFKCDYCNKELKTEKGIAEHEDKRCWHRPEHMTCFTCGLFVDEEVYNDHANHGRLFMGLPACEEEYDKQWQDHNGLDHDREEPVRQFECEYYEPRSDHPGEYVKFSTGTGGYRKVYLEAK